MMMKWAQYNDDRLVLVQSAAQMRVKRQGKRQCSQQCNKVAIS